MISNIGSGKSTTARKLKAQFPDAFYLNSDEFAKMVQMGEFSQRIFTNELESLYHRMLRSIAGIAGREGIDIIVDATNITVASRRTYMKLAKDTDAAVIAKVHQHPAALERRLAEDRGQEHNMWREVHVKFEHLYNEPTLEEGFTEIRNVEQSW